MAKKRYVVRVAIPAIDKGVPGLAAAIPGEFLESLRYAGLISLHHDNEERQTFDLQAPAGIGDTKLWSEMNAERMKTFGYNAVSAPAMTPIAEEAPVVEPEVPIMSAKDQFNSRPVEDWELNDAEGGGDQVPQVKFAEGDRVRFVGPEFPVYDGQKIAGAPDIGQYGTVLDPRAGHYQRHGEPEVNLIVVRMDGVRKATVVGENRFELKTPGGG